MYASFLEYIFGEINLLEAKRQL